MELLTQIEQFIKEKNYHLDKDEVLEAIKTAVESAFEMHQKKVVFNPQKAEAIEFGHAGEIIHRDQAWVVKHVGSKQLLLTAKEHIERYEREKIYAIYRPYKATIIKAIPVGETFFLGRKGTQIIDLRHEFQGEVREFGHRYGIYVEGGKETIKIPSGNWNMWSLARIFYEGVGYTMSINPHRKILRLKKQPKAVVWNVNGVEAIMPPDERISGEEYDIEQDVILYNVNQTALEGFQLYVSRRQIDFLVKYLYQFIPELKEYKVKAVAREPGVMAKIMFEGNGIKVSKYIDEINRIQKMLNGERIEFIFKKDRDPGEILGAALNYDGSIKVDSLKKEACVITSHKGKVIGKGGINVKLAGMLTGYKISVKSLDEYINDTGVFA